MSVIAWDGKHVAADRQATNADMRRATRKVWRISGDEIAACTGEEAGGLDMVRWYEMGAAREKFPAAQATDRWTRLIVFTERGAKVYEQAPEPIILTKPFMAWGSGRDFAMGAMAMGADARRAVQIASKFNIACGMGVDVVRIR